VPDRGQGKLSLSFLVLRCLLPAVDKLLLRHPFYGTVFYLFIYLFIYWGA
jgi:hypothetical protein